MHPQPLEWLPVHEVRQQIHPNKGFWSVGHRPQISVCPRKIAYYSNWLLLLPTPMLCPHVTAKQLFPSKPFFLFVLKIFLIFPKFLNIFSFLPLPPSNRPYTSPQPFLTFDQMNRALRQLQKKCALPERNYWWTWTILSPTHSIHRSCRTPSPTVTDIPSMELGGETQFLSGDHSMSAAHLVKTPHKINAALDKP